MLAPEVNIPPRELEAVAPPPKLQPPKRKTLLSAVALGTAVDDILLLPGRLPADSLLDI